MNQKQINEICDSGKLIYCFDLDGTISELGVPGGNLLKAIPKMNVVKRIRKLFKGGHYITILTGRPSWKSGKTREWLSNNEIPYHEIRFGKPRAHIYIDDSTVDVDEYMTDPEMYDKKYLEYGNSINKLIREEKL